VTTLPPTYMRECKRPPRSSVDFSRAITRAAQSSCSSARSKRATILKWCQQAQHIPKWTVTYLSRRLKCWAFFPSMYRVLGFPGRLRITPSNTVPRLGEETETPCACGIALSAFRGNSVVRKSSVALACLALMAETPSTLSESSRLCGGVTRPVSLGCLRTISWGQTDGGGGLMLKRGGRAGESCSGGGVGGYWMRKEPWEEV
jgi:hypothetical protein